MKPAKPPSNMEMLIDIQFRNGSVRRGTQGKKWRWGAWSGQWAHIGDSDYDIIDWWPNGRPK